MKFEIDTYWAANFGACDPAEQVSKFKARTPLLHIKDGPLDQGPAAVRADLDDGLGLEAGGQHRHQKHEAGTPQ